MFDIVMGKTGSGKSTYLTAKALRAIKHHKDVYSNVAINGCYKIDVKQLGSYQINNCLLIIDEAGFEFNSREFKTFKKELYRFFTMHRHYGIDIILAVQYWDRVDIVIRELLKDIYVCKPSLMNLLGFIRVKRIGVSIDIDENTRQITEVFKWCLLSSRYYYKSRYYGKFDSFYKDDIPLYNNLEKWIVIKQKKSFRNKLKELKNKLKKYKIQLRKARK